MPRDAQVIIVIMTSALSLSALIIFIIALKATRLDRNSSIKSRETKKMKEQEQLPCGREKRKEGVCM
eukprot:scaffold2689_cov70-Skeletonema_marinoi.AAC.7